MTGDEVKRARVALGLTQERFAAELGVTFSTVSRWENGHTLPSRLATLAIQRLADSKKVGTASAP